MRPIIAVASLLLLLQLALPVRADATGEEIAYLLSFIRKSSCTFIRNGSEYDGPAAADHVQQKYDYYKGDIRTAEDFIDRAATKSLLSGDPYKVRCGSGSPVLAADWLRSVLQSYRTHQAPQGTQ